MRCRSALRNSTLISGKSCRWGTFFSFPDSNPSSGRILREWFCGMVPPDILRCIQLHQCISHRLANIPIMIFLIGMKGNNNGSVIVDVRAVFEGHAGEYPISLFLSAKSGNEYIGNAGQCQKHLPKLFQNLDHEGVIQGLLPPWLKNSNEPVLISLMP